MRRGRISKEEIDMRALVLSEASSFADAARRLTEMGYPVVRNTLHVWAKDNPKFVPPATLERLYTYARRPQAVNKAPPVRTPTPPERKPGPVVVKRPETPAEFGQAVIDAMVSLKSRVKALEEQVATKNAQIAEAERRYAVLEDMQKREAARWRAEEARLREELEEQQRPDNGFAEQLAELVKL